MNSYLCFVSESVVLTRRRQIAIAGAKNVCGVSFAPLMKPCTKSFICPPVHALFKKFIPPVMFFWRHPVHRRSEQFKLMDKQINKMFEHGVPSFFCPPPSRQVIQSRWTHYACFLNLHNPKMHQMFQRINRNINEHGCEKRNE